MFRTPDMVLMMIGKSAPRKITATFDCQSMPNQMMKSGMNTIRGVLYRKFTKGSSAYWKRVYQPIPMPSARPMTIALT